MFQALHDVSFWYRDRGIDLNGDAYPEFCDGSTYDNIFELGNTSLEDKTFDVVPDFHIRLDW